MTEDEKRNLGQISVLKTNKALIEFRDKLTPAPTQNYAHLHADGEKDGDYTLRSLIGIVMQDYSHGTGDSLIRVTANISPDDAAFLFSRCQAGFQEVKFQQDKIFGQPDQQGHSQVTRLSVERSTQMNIPWRITLENGVGIKQQNQNGGTYMQRGSYKCQKKVSINVTDQDFHSLLWHVVQYILCWQFTMAPSRIRSGRKALEDYKREIREARVVQDQSQGNLNIQISQPPPGGYGQQPYISYGVQQPI